MNLFQFLAPLFALVAFILSLLPAISTPVTKSITLFKVSVNTTVSVSVVDAEADVDLSFGVWGYCISNFNVTASIQGTDLGTVEGNAYCSSPKAGYTFDDEFSEVINQLGIDFDIDSIRDSISIATTVAVALHIAATVFTFITLPISLSSIFARRLACCSLITVLFTAILTTVAFVFDIILVLVLRSKLSEYENLNMTTSWGNAPWLMLAATITMWLAAIGACSERCCGGRQKYVPVSSHQMAQRNEASWEKERMIPSQGEAPRGWVNWDEERAVPSSSPIQETHRDGAHWEKERMVSSPSPTRETYRDRTSLENEGITSSSSPIQEAHKDGVHWGQEEIISSSSPIQEAHRDGVHWEKEKTTSIPSPIR